MRPRSSWTVEVKSVNDIADTLVCGAIVVESDDAPVAADAADAALRSSHPVERAEGI